MNYKDNWVPFLKYSDLPSENIIYKPRTNWKFRFAVSAGVLGLFLLVSLFVVNFPPPNLPILAIDAVKEGETLYALIAEQKRSDFKEDPQLRKFYRSKVRMLIKRGQETSEGPLITELYLPHDPHGAISVQGDRIKMFLNFKVRPGVYEMNGILYSLDVANGRPINAETLFEDKNRGWFARFEGENLIHFSFDGYRLVRQNALLSITIAPSEAKRLRDEWVANHSGGLLPSNNTSGWLVPKETWLSWFVRKLQSRGEEKH